MGTEEKHDFRGVNCAPRVCRYDTESINNEREKKKRNTQQNAAK